MRLESVYVTIPLGFFTFALVSPKFGVHLPCLYIKGAPKHFLQHSTLLLGATSILCILSRTSFGSFLSASLYSLSKTSETEKKQSYSRLFKKHCTMHATIPIKCFWWFYIVTKLSSLTRCWFFFFSKCTFSEDLKSISIRWCGTTHPSGCPLLLSQFHLPVPNVLPLSHPIRDSLWVVTNEDRIEEIRRGWEIRCLDNIGALCGSEKDGQDWKQASRHKELKFQALQIHFV